MRSPFGHDRDLLNFFHGFLPHGPVKHLGQRLGQAWPCHGEQIQVRLASRWLQVAAGLAAEINNIAVRRDQHRRRCESAQQHLVGQGLQIGFAGCLAGQTRHGVGGWRARAAVHGQLPQAEPARTAQAAENPRLQAQRHEQIALARCLGAAQHQQAAGVQAAVEQVRQFLLHAAFQVDQQVAAGQDVELGKRPVAGDALLRKDNHGPNVFADYVAAGHLDEVARQAVLRHIGGDVVGVKADARFFNRALSMSVAKICSEK